MNMIPDDSKLVLEVYKFRLAIEGKAALFVFWSLTLILFANGARTELAKTLLDAAIKGFLA